MPAEVRALARDQLPTVLVDVAHGLLPNVAIDDVAGGALAARHLLEAGHRCVAFVGDVEDSPFAFASSQRRLEGFGRTLAEAGVALPESRVRRGPFGRETAVLLTRQLLALRHPPTAIFAASDVQAFGVLDAAARAGLAVPGDLSVVGFDDIELAAAIGLTTVRQPLRESGRVGAQLLLRALAGDEGSAPGSTLELPALEVVARRTVSPPLISVSSPLT
jgi:DNA-binding LacI/PurR family transcriptional regulator